MVNGKWCVVDVVVSVVLGPVPRIYYLFSQGGIREAGDGDDRVDRLKKVKKLVSKRKRKRKASMN